MRVLWLCNRCLPVIAAHLNMDAGNKEGFMKNLHEKAIYIGILSLPYR